MGRCHILYEDNILYLIFKNTDDIWIKRNIFIIENCSLIEVVATENTIYHGDIIPSYSYSFDIQDIFRNFIEKHTSYHLEKIIFSKI